MTRKINSAAREISSPLPAALTDFTAKAASYSNNKSRQKSLAVWASIENEIEAKFLVPKYLIKPYLNSNKLIKINQVYISKNKRARAISKLLRSRPQIHGLLSDDLKTFRLRKQKYRDGRINYFAQLKTKRLSLSRTEISIPLSIQLYRQLSKFADAGSVSKTRIIRTSSVLLDGQRKKNEAHIDILSALGTGKNKITGSDLPDFLNDFVIVEVELPCESAYRILRQENWGSFTFLKKAINLQERQSQSGERISSRALSKGRLNKPRLQRVFQRLISLNSGNQSKPV